MRTTLESMRAKLRNKHIEPECEPESTPAINNEMIRELREFDWIGHKGTGRSLVDYEKPYLIFQTPPDENDYDRKLRMLSQVRKSCMACSMCELGRSGASIDEKLYRDPHVFSNLNPTRFVIICQNPGWGELCECGPLAGDNFDRAIAVHSLKRDDFYICNMVRCYTGSVEPTDKQINQCKPFIDIELGLIDPLLVIALGSLVFNNICPGIDFDMSLGNIIKSQRYNKMVFAMYDPNMIDLGHNKSVEFNEQIRLMCGIVNHLKSKYGC